MGRLLRLRAEATLAPLRAVGAICEPRAERLGTRVSRLQWGIIARKPHMPNALSLLVELLVYYRTNCEVIVTFINNALRE